MTIKGDIYLIARYLRVPKFKGMTSQKNFGQNEDNWQWNEEVNFKQKVSDKDFKSAGVILGLHKKEIIRNSMNPSANYDTLYTYFYSNGYSKQLDEVRNAEQMVKDAIDEAMAKYKAEHNDATPEEVAETEPWKFPKAEDFKVTEDHPKVSFGANPPKDEYIGMTAEELKQAMEQEKEND